ncbi:MAG TPA: tetratricopeptide repeat protein [Candidatus Methylacidiphilales bacterium]|nr:tetratricopeptide repeat protein [Candidatus Methylacidiphilales bacterium]
MAFLSANDPVQGQKIPLSEEQYQDVLAATNAGRALDAWHLAQQIGPLESWIGPEAMVLAARLAGHLGGASLSWRLAQQAVRAYPDLARVRLQHFFGLLERRGHFSAWHYLPRLERCVTEVPLDRAEILVARSDVHLAFRDFGVASACVAEAQKLAPESPWIWTQSAHYWQAQNQSDAALPYLDYALHLQPWYRPAVQMRAHLLQNLGRDDEALALLEEAGQHLQFWGIYNQIATICSERENWSGLKEAVLEARARAPLAEEGLQFWFTLREADALTGLGDFSRAAVKAEEAGKKVGWYKKLAERLQGMTAPGRRVKIDVPYIRQDFNTCAPATLSAITTFWQRPIAQETLINEICYDGTTAVAERRWIEANGWFCREFKVDWDIATQLLDLGLPFILNTQEIDSGHAQCLIGYDTVRGTLLIRDPNVRHHTEMSYEEFIKHYEPVGPRGVLVLPPEQAPLVAGLDFPETALYDLVYEIASALDAYDRPRADAALAQLAQVAPNHRHYWMACRALAGYDQNPVQSLDAVDHLRELYPDDDRLIHARVALLRHLGRGEEAQAALAERRKKRGAVTALWNDYAEEQRGGRGGMNRALRFLWRRLRHQPQNIAALTRFSLILWENQLKEESLEIQRLTVSISDKNEQTAGVYFRMLLGLGRGDEGIDFLQRRATQLLPLSGNPTLTLAESLHQLYRTQEARETLAAALQQRPADGMLLLYAAELEAIAMQLARSDELLEAAAAHANRLVWLRAAARLQRRAGNQEQALASWQELAQTAPLDLEAHREISLLLARRDGRSAGVAYLQEIGRRFPQHLGVLQLELSWLRGHHDAELEQRLGEFVTANPNNAWAQRELVLFWQRTRPGAADETLLQRAQFARQIDPANSSSWLVEAGVLSALNRENEARKCVRRALEIWIDHSAAQQQLLLLSATEDDKKEALAFILQQLEKQKAAGAGIITYREVAFPVLQMDELSDHLRDFHRRRPDVWAAAKALLVQLISMGRLDEAQEVADAATKRFPLLAETWQQYGLILEHQGDRARAIDFFRFVLELEPERVSAIHHLAGAYRHENRPQEALALLEEAQQRNPLNASLAGAYAENLWRMDRRDEALAVVRRAVELDPEYQWGWDTLSRWSRVVSGQDEAFALCRERAERLQTDADAWLQVARRAHGAGQSAVQLDAALRARAADPYNADVHDSVALALVRQHRFTEALEACWPPEFSGRNPINLRGREAWIFAQQGDLDQAIGAMTELLQINPQYTWGWEVLADCHLRKKNWPAALAAGERLVRLHPLAASGYLRRADIQLQMKKVNEAKRDLQRAFALSPLPAAAWQLLRLHLDARDYPAVEELLRQMQPHIGPAIMMPARMFAAVRRNQIDAALDLFAEMGTLPEVDVNAVNQAVQAIDALKRGDLLNARLGTVMREPGLNPYFAALWVVRRGAFFKWKLLGQYRKITEQPKVQSAFLCEWLNQIGKSKIGLETARLIGKECAGISRQDARVWGNIGRVFVNAAAYREARDWLAGWHERPEIEGWMVTNLVYACHGLGQQAEADLLSREILNRGLRDHTTSVHLCFLAISALEAGQTAEARAFSSDIEPQNLRPEQAYIQSLIHAALLVQEAATPREKESVFLAQQPHLDGKRPPGKKALPVMIQAQEKRCLAVMARDAGKPKLSPSRSGASANRLPKLELPPPPDEFGAVPESARRSARPRVSKGRSILSSLRLIAVCLVLLWVIAGIISNLVSQSSSAGPPSSSAASPNPAVPVVPVPSPLTPGDQAQQAFDGLAKGESLPRLAGEIRDALSRAPADPKVLCIASEFELRLRASSSAAALAQKATVASPDDARALGDLALSLVLSNHLAEARAPADRALEIDPHNGPALAARSVIAAATKNWDQAFDLIGQAVDADPDNGMIWILIDTLYEGAKRQPDGEAKLRQLLQKYPNSESGWFALGACLGLQGNAAAALAAYDHAKTINPNDYLLWNSIGLAHARNNEPGLALEAFQRSASLNPAYDEAWNNCGYALLQQGKTDEAIEDFKKVLKINPRHSRALVNLANAYIQTGQLDQASATCDMLAVVDPKLADSLRAKIR